MCGCVYTYTCIYVYIKPSSYWYLHFQSNTRGFILAFLPFHICNYLFQHWETWLLLTSSIHLFAQSSPCLRIISQSCLSPDPTILTMRAATSAEKRWQTLAKSSAELPAQGVSKLSPSLSPHQGEGQGTTFHSSRHFILLTHGTYCLLSPAFTLVFFLFSFEKSAQVSVPQRNLPPPGQVLLSCALLVLCFILNSL